MAESQSRYSIVERLTSQKLGLMSGKSSLKEEARLAEQRIGKLKKDLENWRKDVQEDVRRDDRKRQLEIERSQREYENMREQLQDKTQVLDEQIKAVEEALKSIEEISRSSPTIQS